MSDYEYICPSCGKPMDVREPRIERNIFKNDPSTIAFGMAHCEKCQIKVISPDAITPIYDRAHAEEKLAKAQATFDNMLKSFGIKKRPKPKPCPSCGGSDFRIKHSEPRLSNGEWSSSIAQIKCSDCGMLLSAGGAYAIHKDEAQKLADIVNETVINTWNSLECGE